MSISTVRIFHGPGAQAAAVACAGADAYLVDGEEAAGGLTVGQVRDIIPLLQSVPVGGGERCIVLGPMDRTKAQSSDILLKIVEEPRANSHVAVLWAFDLGGVSGTLRSRCRAIWSPADAVLDETMLADARQGLLDALSGKAGDLSLRMTRWKGKESELLDAICKNLARDRKALALWPSLRKTAMDARGPLASELASILAGSAR